MYGRIVIIAARNITVSVIMPSFNAERYIAEAIDSALQEMQPQDELIIHDGGSTDSTSAVVDVRARVDSRVRFYVEKDTGQSDALNRALQKATGDFILWLNADDVLTVGGLDALRAHTADPSRAIHLVTGGHSTARANGSIIARYRPKPLTHKDLMDRGCYIFSGSILTSRTELLRVGGFSERFNFCMDLDLLLRLTRLAGASMVHTTNLVGVLRWHDASKSGGQGRRFILEGMKVRLHHSAGWMDYVRTVRAATVQALALMTIPLRHSPIYAIVRGRADA